MFYEEKEDRQTQLAQAQQNLLVLNSEIDQLQKDIAESSLNEEERLKLLQDVQLNRQQADQELAVLQEQEKQLRRDVKLSAERIQTEQEAIGSLKGKQDQVAKLADTETLTIQEIATQLKSASAEKERFDAELRQLREAKKANRTKSWRSGNRAERKK